jgi:hypothetical protein
VLFFVVVDGDERRHLIIISAAVDDDIGEINKPARYNYDDNYGNTLQSAFASSSTPPALSMLSVFLPTKSTASETFLSINVK